MSDPVSLQDFTARFQMSRRVWGIGVNTWLAMPCPFCAAPNFLIFRALEFTTALVQGAMCQSCGRSARGIITYPQGSVAVQLVQNGGPAQPAWLQPPLQVVPS